MQTRTVPLDSRAVPASFNESTRSVEIVVATEQPVMVYDRQRGEMVNEILRMDGLDPMPQQVPFLDSHNRYSTSAEVGACPLT